jgi:hypothetical protein
MQSLKKFNLNHSAHLNFRWHCTYLREKDAVDPSSVIIWWQQHTTVLRSTFVPIKILIIRHIYHVSRVVHT